MKNISIGLLVCLICSLFSIAIISADEINFDNVPADKWTGEPYGLAGNRVVFTNWYYVRTGSFRWTDDKGSVVSANRQAKIGPWGAHFKRTPNSPYGIRLIAERPKHLGPILKAQRPWEQMGISINFILHEKDKYRAWAGVQDQDGKGYTCYYESKDGLNWQRPNLGLVEYQGSKDNNLIPSAPHCVFIDPTADASQRYKGVSDEPIPIADFPEFIKKHPDRWEHRALRKDAGFIAAVHGYVSPDGLSWTKLPEPFTVEHCDTQVIATYNAPRKKYVIYTRNWWVGPRSSQAPANPIGMDWLSIGRRSIGMTESNQFGNFPLSKIILTPRSDAPPGNLLYTNCYTTIPGAPDHHLLFPTIWQSRDDATHLEMYAGPDGQIWNLVPGGSLMETAEFGKFDGGCIFWRPNLIELPNGDFALVYTGYQFPHKYPRGAWTYAPGYAVWPKARLVALEAKEQGQFEMASLIVPGPTLLINATTARAGSIRIAVEGDSTRTFDTCIPVIGDQHWTPVKWKGASDLGSIKDRPIRLQFKLDSAKIYGLQFE